MTQRQTALLLLCLMLGLARSPRAEAKNSLAPAAGWRLRLAVDRVAGSSAGAAAIPGLCKDTGRAWPQSERGPVTLDLALPEARKSALLLVVSIDAATDEDVSLRLSGSRKPGKGLKVLDERMVAVRSSKSVRGPRLAHLTFPKGASRVARLQLVQEADGPSPKIARLRVYRLDKKGRNDYWLFLGASLTVGGTKPDTFAEELRRQHPGCDPYVANEAISGWSSRHVLAALPAFLKEHRHARYVAIHIGGNNVSAARPYPGGADRLGRELEQILRQIREAGKLPILARLTYRAYKAKGKKPGVPPEANGSGPYVKKLYDPLIRKHCPDFYDAKEGRGTVDLYGYFKAHSEEIGGDGIHLRGTGYASWRRLWAQLAGGRIYRGKPR
jgi:lysophospholipase L1-like esterase